MTIKQLFHRLDHANFINSVSSRDSRHYRITCDYLDNMTGCRFSVTNVTTPFNYNVFENWEDFSKSIMEEYFPEVYAQVIKGELKRVMDGFVIECDTFTLIFDVYYC